MSAIHIAHEPSTMNNCRISDRLKEAALHEHQSQHVVHIQPKKFSVLASFQSLPFAELRGGNLKYLESSYQMWNTLETL
jgi:hypothetical protein